MPLTTPDLTEFTTTSPIINSVTFTELATGVGIVDVFAMTTTDDSGLHPALQTNSSYKGSTSSLDVTSTDYTFVMKGIIKPFSIGGSMKLNFHTSGKTAADNNNKVFNIVITILKNAETIATITTQTISTLNNDTLRDWAFSLEKDIPFTHFSKNDELKIKFDWIQSVGAPYQNFKLWIDNTASAVTGNADQKALESGLTTFKIGLPIPQ